MHTRTLARVAMALAVTLIAGATALAQKPSQTATQFYMAYRVAFDKASKMDEILPYMAAKNRAQAEATPADQREKMFELVKMMSAVTDVKVLKETRSPDGGATLTVEGVDSDKKKGTGTVVITKENGEWKVGKESWSFGS